MTISAVGAMQQTGGSGTVSSLALTTGPAAVGNALIVAIDRSVTDVSVTALSGGGCGSNWQKLIDFDDTSARAQYLTLWVGTVSTAGGTPTISVTYSNATTQTGVDSTQIDCQEFTAGLGASTVWALDNNQKGSVSSASGTTSTTATLVPTGAGRLFVALFEPTANASSAGSTSGFTYRLETAWDNGCFAFNPNFGPGSGACTSNITSTGAPSTNVAALLTASVPATAIPQQPLVVGQAVRRAAFY